MDDYEETVFLANPPMSETEIRELKQRIAALEKVAEAASGLCSSMGCYGYAGRDWDISTQLMKALKEAGYLE
jgi:hypothetical protein